MLESKAFGEATLAEIMERAGVTVGAFYRRFPDKDALLLGDPDVFFTTPHYDNYPVVLVRLEAVSEAQLAELVEDAWRTQAGKRVIAKFDAGE